MCSAKLISLEFDLIYKDLPAAGIRCLFTAALGWLIHSCAKRCYCFDFQHLNAKLGIKESGDIRL